MQQDDQLKILNSPNVSYVIYRSEDDLALLDMTGHIITEGNYDEISLLSDSTFKFKRNDRVGIIDHHGQIIVEPRYDVADEQDGMIFLLQDQSIGCFDLQRNINIPARYDARIIKFGPHHYQVQKNGKKGLVDTLKNQVVPTIYDELLLWNDTSLWARDADHWQLITFHNDILRSDILAVDIIIDNQYESFATIRTNMGKGLLSSRIGEVLLPEYNDIINLGSPTEPIFFAEQHLKSAAFYVATYFDRVGKSIKSQAFRPEEYERIYCDL